MTTTSLGFLPYGRHWIGEDDIAAVTAVLNSDRLTTGPVVEQFETALAEQVGARQAVACSSGTAALHLSLAAVGVRAGDTVIVPAITFVATANAARYLAARVIFADVDPNTGLMGVEHAEAVLRRAGEARTRIVLPVHLNGQCEDLPGLRRLAEAYNARVIEDACHALGTTYRASDGSAVAVGACRDSDMAAFSFHPVKTIAMGEGGAVTTNDDGFATRLRRLRNHGITQEPERFINRDLALRPNGAANPWYHELIELGYNYRASDIHCALGLSQLGKLDRFVARRRELAARYDALLASLAPEVRPVARTPSCNPAWHLYVVQIDFAGVGLSRAEVMDRLRERGIGTQVHYLPLPWQPCYRDDNRDVVYPGAARYYESILTLPLFPEMSDESVDRVADSLAELLGR